MPLNATDIELISKKILILNEEEISNVNIVVDYEPSGFPTHFTKHDRTIHINKGALALTALTSGIKEEVVLTIRMYLEIAHAKNCEVPSYDRYQQLLFLKESGKISIDELMEFSRLLNDLEQLAWDYCENRIRSEHSIHFEDCRRLRAIAFSSNLGTIKF